MAKKFVFRNGIIEEVEQDDNILVLSTMSGYFEPVLYAVQNNTVVSYNEVSLNVRKILEDAFCMAHFIRLRFVSDALFLAATNNLNEGRIYSNLFNNISLRIPFSNEVSNLINQHERVDSHNFDFAPQFIRQFENADVIRKTRHANEIQTADILKAILYSRSAVGDLMLRYGIDDAKITTCCRE